VGPQAVESLRGGRPAGDAQQQQDRLRRDVARERGQGRERLSIEPLRVVEREKHGSLGRDRTHRGAERVARGHGGHGGSKPFTEIGVELSEGREGFGRRAGDPGRVGKPARQETRERAPWHRYIGGDRARRGHRGFIQPCAREQLLQEPGLPFARLSLEEHDLSAAGLRAPPCAGELRELRGPTHEGRARASRRRRGRADHPTPDPGLPDSLHEALGLGTGLRPEHPPERSRQLLGYLQCSSSVPGERQRAHRGARRGLGCPVECHSPQGRLRRCGRVTPFKLRHGTSLERLEGARPPQHALGPEPVLELARLRNGQPFEELPVHERCGCRPFAAPAQLGETITVERDRVRDQTHLIHVRAHTRIAEHPAQHAECFAERVTSLLFIAVAPQHADQVLARATQARAARQIHEEGDVFAPQQFRGGIRPRHRDADRAEDAAGQGRHSAPIIGAAATIGKRGYILSRMQPPALDAVQRAVGDRYEVLSLAGVGGMGAVFRARHRTLGHIVAVKVLPPEVAASGMRRERFRREATLGASLDHPHVVRVYDFDTRDGISFLIMTFVRGDSLEERLRNSARLTTDQVLRIVREIGDALGYAHRRGIVHRDVKPANILLDEDSGRALLADFGIARVEGAEETSLTQPGAAIGTPGYMAPEQTMSGRVDGRADLYSLAVVAFEALAGAPPVFQSRPASLARTLRIGPSKVSARLAAALVTPLAGRPDDRPAKAGAWLAQLDAAQRRAWRPWAAAAILAVSGAGVLRIVTGARGSCGLPRDEPNRLAVMPFAVLGTAPYPASQLPEYFISRFRPVERLSEVVSFGRVAAQLGSEVPSNEEARELACRLGARFFVLGSVAYAGPAVTLNATLYEGGRSRRSGTATGRVGVDESAVMDRVWVALYPEFTPGPDVTLPNGGPEALAAYLNAEAAFRRGDYRTARDEYTRVIKADSDFAIGRLRLALVAAQVDPTEQGFGSALRGAERYQRGLSTADSLLLDGFRRLVSDGDGVTALDRFKRATEVAPGYSHAWYMLGEFYIHFGGLFDQPVGEAGGAFNRVLDIDPRFSPAIAHLIPLANQSGDRRETAELIHRYLRIDSTSVVAEEVGIADTLLLGTAPAQLALLRTVCRHSFLALQVLGFQAALFGTPAQREGPARVVLRCLERHGATDAERRLSLRMGVAADLAAGWPDSARQRLARATGAWAAEERDLWILVAHVTGVATLGDPAPAAIRLGSRVRAAPDTDAVAHWLLARLGIEQGRHAAALARLASRGPLTASLTADLQARDALRRGDSARALRLWDGATRRYAVLSAPLELLASLWPLRRDMARVAVARGETAAVARACGSFETLIGYVDQIVQPEVARLCGTSRPR